MYKHIHIQMHTYIMNQDKEYVCLYILCVFVYGASHYKFLFGIIFYSLNISNRKYLIVREKKSPLQNRKFMIIHFLYHIFSVQYHC